MKRFYIATLLSLASILGSFAQEQRSKPPFLILQSGFGLKISTSPQVFFSVSAEKPLTDFWHVGLSGNWYSGENEDLYSSSSFSSQQDFGGFEIGGFAKYFMHGSLSNRKSSLYFSPEFRIGTLQFEGVYFGDFSPGLYVYRTTQYTQKYLLRCGAQWMVGNRTVIELALPLGWEHSKIVTRTTYNQTEYQSPTHTFGKFVMMPGIQMGFAF